MSMSQTVVRSFEELGVSEASLKVLAAAKLVTPTPIQAETIPALKAGKDVVGQARTGSGKTLAFAIPLVERCEAQTPGIQALVLAPTRELAIQISSVITPLANAHGLRVTLLYGGRSLQPEQQQLRRAQIVVGTPGRTLDHIRQGNLKLQKLTYLVLDEGDEMLDRGFAPDVERIMSQTPATRQTALFSATLPDWISTMVKRHMRAPQMVRVDGGTPPPEIEHLVYEVSNEKKINALAQLLDETKGAVLVFGRTKHGVRKLADRLVKLGYPIASLQGNLSQNARERVLTAFRKGQVRMLVATNVAARGLDVSGIEQVINYELPETAELFTHRSGRTGRMGRKGEVITLISYEEAPKLRAIERQLGRTLPRQRWQGNGTTLVEPRAVAPVQRPHPNLPHLNGEGIRQALRPAMQPMRRSQPSRRPAYAQSGPSRW